MSAVPTELRERAEHLAPYARRAVARAHAFALDMHAEELTVEHLFSSLLADEDSAAAQAVLHAFADPQTLAIELMAMSPGITLVGAERCLPFSVRAVAALRAAHGGARRSGAEVEPRDVLAAALPELAEDAAARLREVAAALPDPPGAEAAAAGASGSIFQSFSGPGKRAASRAGYEAVRQGRPAIAPAHLVVGALEVDDALAAVVGLTAARARARVAGADADPTPPEPRAIPATPALVAFLGGAPAGADSLALLEHLLASGADELVQLFVRQRVTPDAVERGRGFRDPEA